MFRGLMRLMVCLSVCLSSGSSLCAQEPEAPTINAAVKSENRLTAEWFGTWRGEVEATSLKGQTSVFQMELTVQPLSEPGRWQWQIVYSGPQGESKRPYELVTSQEQPGQFVIDEKNGILIDTTLLGNTIVSQFAVQGQSLISRYRLRNTGPDASAPSIEFEILAGPSKVASTSGGQNDVPAVESWLITSRQSAVLKRVDETPANESTTNVWKRLPTEAYRGKQDDIFFMNPTLGWYVNGAGKIFKTTDGGESWSQMIHQPGTYFRCIAFVDENLGFAGNIGPGYFPGVTDTNPLYQTTDGGTTWTPVSSVTADQVVGLCALQVVREDFINAGKLDQHIRVVGVGRVSGPVAMIVSDDLGKTFQSIEMPKEAAMAFDVHFWNRREGFVAAASHADVSQSNAMILRTEDGGKTWAVVYQSARPFELTWKMAFPTRETGYVTIQSYNPDMAVTDRFVAKTTDGGKTWSELPLVQDFRVREFGIAFLDENTGWVGAVPSGFETRDGGKTWQKASMGNAVNKIRILPTETEHLVWAIGTEVHRLNLKKPQPTIPR